MPYLEPNLHGFKGSDGTSYESAVTAATTSAERRQTILALLTWDGQGMTADEIADALGYSVLAIRPRVSELRNMGLIEPTGERRRNASGMSAAVVRIKGAA
jgi:predicted ArsR family transcriptional regulator